MADAIVYGEDFHALARRYKDMGDGTYAEVVSGIGGSSGDGSVNVKTYGAKGDGSTDDTTAIANAIAAANTAGGLVDVPAGTYITSPIALPPGVVLRGVNGQAYYNATSTVPNAAAISRLKLKAGSASALISPDDTGANKATACKIVDLCLDCNGINQPAINLPDQGGSISRFWTLDGVYVVNVNSANAASGYAVYIGNQNTAVTMRDCILFNGTSGSAAGWNGLGWYGSDGRADNCYIGYFANTGLNLLGGTADETLTWRGGGIFTCNVAVAVGQQGAVFSDTSFDHCQADGVFINNGPVSFTGCTWHTNSMVGNGSNSNIKIGGNNVTVSLVNCRAAPIDTGSNNPAWMVNDGGTGNTVYFIGTPNEGVTFTSGWTNAVGPGTTYATPLASSTTLTADSTVHALVTSPSLPVGTYLVTATLTTEGTSTSSVFVDFGVLVGTATAAFAGPVAGAVSQPAAASEFICSTNSVSCIVTVTVAGTLTLSYWCNGTISARATGVNHNFGASTGIAAVRLLASA